jgi:hypothetical protein
MVRLRPTMTGLISRASPEAVILTRSLRVISGWTVSPKLVSVRRHCDKAGAQKKRRNSSTRSDGACGQSRGWPRRERDNASGFTSPGGSLPLGVHVPWGFMSLGGSRPLGVHVPWGFTSLGGSRPLGVHVPWGFTSLGGSRPLGVHVPWGFTSPGGSRPLGVHVPWGFTSPGGSRPLVQISSDLIHRKRA